MKDVCFKMAKLLALVGTLPFVYGCGSGGGSGSLLSFLFGSTGIGGGLALLGGAGADAEKHQGARECQNHPAWLCY